MSSFQLCRRIMPLGFLLPDRGKAPIKSSLIAPDGAFKNKQVEIPYAAVRVQNRRTHVRHRITGLDPSDLLPSTFALTDDDISFRFYFLSLGTHKKPFQEH